MEYPKLFISYSWSNDDHINWVINLATELRDSGVDVILDKWDLKEGNCANSFMEKMVSDDKIKKVIIVCDREYANKSDQKKGGVGTETQIISPEVYSKVQQDKFVAVISEKDANGKPYLPIYLKSRIHIDLSDDNIYASNFQQLLRWIYGEPTYPKPPIGKKPSFLKQENQINLETEILFRRAVEAIRQSKGSAQGNISEFFSLFCLNLEKFRISNQTSPDVIFDDQLIKNIEEFIPYKNQIIELISLIAQYNTPNTIDLIHRFFENLIPYMQKPENVTLWTDTDFDNFKFIINELFLYTIAIFLRNERFELVGELIHKEYYIEKSDYGTSETESFCIFRTFLNSLKTRNNRLSLRRSSLHADLIKERATASGVEFKELMQADFVLYVNSLINRVQHGHEILHNWYPETLVYLGWNNNGSKFEIFTRGKSKKYFNKIKCILNINSKDELSPLIKTLEEDKLKEPGWDYRSISSKNLLNYELLDTST
jgi:hypothetical protein